MMDVLSLRRAFPYLDSCIYLNTASVGISPKGSGAAAARFYDDYKSKGYDGRAAWRELEVDLQRRLARLLKTPEHLIGFVGSTTEALNLVASGMRMDPGEQVIFAADEFPSVRLAWERHRLAGIEVLAVPIRNEKERTIAIADAVGPRTRAVCVSHVHWCTGTRVDLPVLSEACRKYGAALIVDGVQAAGAIDVCASYADVYTASVFKWLLSAFGVGFLAISSEFQKQLEPAFRGYGNEQPSCGLRYSHVNYPGLEVLRASLDHLESIGWAFIFDRVEQLTRILCQGLHQAGFSVVTPSAQRAGIVSVEHPDAEKVVDALSRLGCRTELRDGLIRFSPHFYNTEEEIQIALNTLAKVSVTSAGGL